MNHFKFMLAIILCIIIIHIYFHQTSTTDIFNSDSSESLGFVKPEQRLYKIFSKISSGSKIKLNGQCTKYIYNKNTLDQNMNTNIIKLLKKMLSTINHISSQEYYIKNIENVYCLIGRNQRYIVDFFLYDVNNYYTIRIISDILVIDGDIYINYINTQNGSNPILLNNYDIKFNTSGILLDANMFHENIEDLLNKFYAKNFTVLSVNNDSNLEYTSNDLSGVYNVNSLYNLYFPTNVSNKTLGDYNKKGILEYNENYLPPNQKTIYSQNVCNDNSCVINNYSTQRINNEPYNAPGVVYNRVSNDKYNWLKTGSGTIYNLL